MRTRGCIQSKIATNGGSWRFSNEHGAAERLVARSAGAPCARDGLRDDSPHAWAASAGSRARARRALRQCHAARAYIRHARTEHDLFRGGARDRDARIRLYRGTGEIPHARGGDRMSHFTALPMWIAMLIAVLVVLGATLALIGSVGLLRLK